MPNPLAGLWPHKALARAKALLTQSEHLAQRDERIEEHEAAIEHAKEALLTKYFDRLLEHLQTYTDLAMEEEIEAKIRALTTLCDTLHGTIARTQLFDINRLLGDARKERRQLEALLDSLVGQAGQPPASKTAVDSALGAHEQVLRELQAALRGQLATLRDIKAVAAGGTHARLGGEAMKALHNFNARLAGLLARERGQLDSLLRSKDAEELTAKLRQWLEALERELAQHERAHPIREEPFAKAA